ncbi:MAG: hypothetical protein JO111_05605 [Caulobacteraceae bacterium]|nr:hypothetical protein [Caulobacteraceae bacterium]
MDQKFDTDQKVAIAAMQAQAQKCRALLEAIAGPNARILKRAQAGEAVWSRVAAERYDRVCAARAAAPTRADAWLDAIRADPDLKAVCDNRWLLGEAVDVLRERLSQVVPIAAPYDDLERSIRQAVTGPDRNPAELADGVAEALRLARLAAAWRAPPQGTRFDRWVAWLKNNPLIAAILIAAAIATGAATLYKSLHDVFAPTPPASQPAAHGARAP